jgi:CO/xanthine dehydrogenase Mo-binding subunit
MMFLHDTSRSYVSVEMDGSVTIRCGVQDIGGGQTSSLAQIAAEILGVDLEDVTVYYGDSAMTPLAGTTTATRQLYMSGNATLKAARAVREGLLKKAAEILDTAPQNLLLQGKKIFIKPEMKKDPERDLTFKDVVKACAADGIPLFNMAQFNAPARELLDFKTGQGQVFPDFTFGTHAVEVAVDVETGKVDVLKLIACFDVGQAINLLSAEGQLEGGALYGLGYGMMEEIIFDKGITLTPSFAQYLIPTSLDSPDVESIMIESGGGVGPFGAKGLGEPSCVSVAVAFANAVADATGTRIYDLPVTAEKIIRALGKI